MKRLIALIVLSLATLALGITAARVGGFSWKDIITFVTGWSALATGIAVLIIGLTFIPDSDR